MNVSKIADMLGIPRANVALVGSKFICGAGNDWDFLVITEEENLRNAGFVPDIDDDLYPGDFTSFRRGNINLILTDDYGFFCSEYAIACAARALYLGYGGDMKTRESRVEFHGIVRDLVSDRITEIPF